MIELRLLHFVSTLVIRQTTSGPQILMGKRAPDIYLGGTWQLITGGIEPGEAAWQAVVREVREEACLEVEKLWRLPRLTEFYSPRLEAICLAPMFVAMVSPDAVETCNPEHTELAWLDFATAAGRMMWPNDRTALAEADELILKGSAAEEHLRIDLTPPSGR